MLTLAVPPSRGGGGSGERSYPHQDVGLVLEYLHTHLHFLAWSTRKLRKFVDTTSTQEGTVPHRDKPA
eukprot:4535613-Prymnesium_polylepis.3